MLAAAGAGLGHRLGRGRSEPAAVGLIAGVARGMEGSVLGGVALSHVLDLLSPGGEPEPFGVRPRSSFVRRAVGGARVAATAAYIA